VIMVVDTVELSLTQPLRRSFAGTEPLVWLEPENLVMFPSGNLCDNANLHPATNLCNRMHEP
jgi:hypothetical protein